jgi:hypothetical protein
LPVKLNPNPEAYGDIAAPELDAEDVISQIENYVEAVEAFFRKEAR